MLNRIEAGRYWVMSDEKNGPREVRYLAVISYLPGNPAAQNHSTKKFRQRNPMHWASLVELEDVQTRPHTMTHEVSFNSAPEDRDYLLVYHHCRKSHPDIRMVDQKHECMGNESRYRRISQKQPCRTQITTRGDKRRHQQRSRANDHTTRKVDYNSTVDSDVRRGHGHRSENASDDPEGSRHNQNQNDIRSQ